MKLIVLAGSKKNATVPLKKERLTVGRSAECSLRVGSDAISRKHCEFVRSSEGVTVADLGSRNGTYVNDAKIEGPTTLATGDHIRIGPLEFRFESEAELSDLKLPKVEGVGEAVARAAEKSRAGGSIEDSISDWLIAGPETSPTAVNETLALSTEETQAIAEKFKQSVDAQGEPAVEGAGADASDEAPPEEKGKKKEPGKLPKDAFGPAAKDSREAAEKILRDMARRR